MPPILHMYCTYTVLHTKGVLYNLNAADENCMLSLPPQMALPGLTHLLCRLCCALVKHTASMHISTKASGRIILGDKVFPCPHLANHGPAACSATVLLTVVAMFKLALHMLESTLPYTLSHVLLSSSGRPVLTQLLEASLARLGDRGTWTQWQWNEQAPCFETAHAFRHADRNCCVLSAVHAARCIPHTPSLSCTQVVR